MSHKRRLVVNTLANGVAQLTAMVAAFVFMPLLIRGFGITEYGLFLLANSVGAYAALLDFGVGTALVKLVAEKMASEDNNAIGELASSALAFYLVVGVIAALGLALTGVFAARIFNVTPAGAQLLRNLFLVAAVISLWTWPAATANYVLAGLQRYTLTARVAVFVTIGNVVSTAIVVALHQGPLVLMIANGFVGIAGSIVMIQFARQQLKGVRVSPFRAKLPSIRSIFLFSWALFVVQIASVIVYQQTDRIVLGVFLGAASISLYEAAGKFQSIVSQLGGFAGSAVMPTASQLHAEDRLDALQSLFLRGAKYTVTLINPVIITLMILSYPLLKVWLGPTFAAQAMNARILILPQLLMMTIAMGDVVIIVMGKLPKRLPYVIGLAVGNLALSLLLVQRFGVLGVVLGTSIPYLVDYPLHVRFVLKEVELSWGRWLSEVILPTFPLLLICVGISGAALYTPLVTRLSGLILIAGTSVAAYWAAIYAVALKPNEREDVRAGLVAVRARFLPTKEA